MSYLSFGESLCTEFPSRFVSRFQTFFGELVLDQGSVPRKFNDSNP